MSKEPEKGSSGSQESQQWWQPSECSTELTPSEAGALSAWWGSWHQLLLQDKKSPSRSTRFSELHRLCADHGAFHCPVNRLTEGWLELLGYFFTYIKILRSSQTLVSVHKFISIPEKCNLLN